MISIYSISENHLKDLGIGCGHLTFLSRDKDHTNVRIEIAHWRVLRVRAVQFHSDFLSLSLSL